MTKGIDVSHWQGLIDWDKVKADPSNIDFVYIKASNGVGGIDPQFSRNANEAHRVGLKIGYYHFATLATTPKAEADYFVSLIKTKPTAEMPYVLDLETNKPGLDKVNTLEWINVFFDELKIQGYSDVALYSYTPFLDTNLPSDHILGTVKLWLAAYTPTPKIPHGWTSYWNWQHSSTGKVDGIAGNVDLNTLT